MKRVWLVPTYQHIPCNHSGLMQAAEVAGALAYLHSMHVVHADLTGNNILLSPSEQDSRGFTAQVGGWLGV